MWSITNYLQFFMTRMITLFIQVLIEENLADNAARLGEHLRADLKANLNPEVAKLVRGRGLLNAVIINHTEGMLIGLCIEIKSYQNLLQLA